MSLPTPWELAALDGGWRYHHAANEEIEWKDSVGGQHYLTIYEAGFVTLSIFDAVPDDAPAHANTHGKAVLDREAIIRLIEMLTKAKATLGMEPRWRAVRYLERAETLQGIVDNQKKHGRPYDRFEREAEQMRREARELLAAELGLEVPA